MSETNKVSRAQSGNKMVARAPKKRQFQTRRIRNGYQRSKKVAQSGKGEVASMSRTELWRSVNVVGEEVSGRLRFEDGGFPVWFNSVSKLYEHYQITNIRIKIQSNFSKMATGGIYFTYNTSEGEEAEIADTAIMAAQRGAKAIQVSENTTMWIDNRAIKRTPDKRQCRGAKSYAFDIGYKISTRDSGTINIFIIYDVRFYTPQLMREGEQPVHQRQTRSMSARGRSVSDEAVLHRGTTGTGIIRGEESNPTVYTVTEQDQVVANTINTAANAYAYFRNGKTKEALKTILDNYRSEAYAIRMQRVSGSEYKFTRGEQAKDEDYVIEYNDGKKRYVVDMPHDKRELQVYTDGKGVTIYGTNGSGVCENGKCYNAITTMSSQDGSNSVEFECTLQNFNKILSEFK